MNINKKNQALTKEPSGYIFCILSYIVVSLQSIIRFKHTLKRIMKRTQNAMRISYKTPTAECIELPVETGFAASNTGSAGWEDGPANEDNTNDMGDF